MEQSHRGCSVPHSGPSASGAPPRPLYPRGDGRRQSCTHFPVKAPRRFSGLAEDLRAPVSRVLARPGEVAVRGRCRVGSGVYLSKGDPRCCDPAPASPVTAPQVGAGRRGFGTPPPASLQADPLPNPVEPETQGCQCPGQLLRASRPRSISGCGVFSMKPLLSAPKPS